MITGPKHLLTPTFIYSTNLAAACQLKVSHLLLLLIQQLLCACTVRQDHCSLVTVQRQIQFLSTRQHKFSVPYDLCAAAIFFQDFDEL